MHDTSAIGGQYISFGKRLGKQCILLRHVVRMGVDGIDEQFALGEVG
jgi:hypothetical protein